MGKITLYNNQHATIGVKPYAARQINEAPPESCAINHSQRIQSLPPPYPPKKENKLLRCGVITTTLQLPVKANGQGAVGEGTKI